MTDPAEVMASKSSFTQFIIQCLWDSCARVLLKGNSPMEFFHDPVFRETISFSTQPNLIEISIVPSGSLVKRSWLINIATSQSLDVLFENAAEETWEHVVFQQLMDE